jgi:8-oxo-dGTP pyrophosphatase MutT (NUDIX family)
LEPWRVLSPGRSAGRRPLISLPDTDTLRARLRGPDPDDGAGGLADDRELADAAGLVEAAVLVGIVTGPAPGVLLTRRTGTLRRHAGQVSFPGGRIDPDDASPEAAALRETWEEVGLPASQIEVCGRMREYVTATGYRITPVLALISPGSLMRMSAAEVESIFELPRSVLLDPSAPTRRAAMFNGVRREYWVWPHATHDIWGATAALLVRLAHRLRG